VNVTFDGILPCVVLGVYTVLTIYVLALVVGDSERIVCLTGYITLAETTFYFGLSDANIGQYTALLD